MKRITQFSMVALLAVIMLASCSKNRDHYRDNIERAQVIDFEDGTPYSIIYYINTRTYAIIESVDNNTQLWPDYDDILEGVFIKGRQTNVYNRTGGFRANIFVVENVNTEEEAYDALYYYNDTYGFARTTDKIAFKNRNILKTPTERFNLKQQPQKIK